MRFAILIIIITFLLGSCGNSEQDDTPIQEKSTMIEIASVVKDSLTLPVISTGMLASETQSNLSFMTGGIIHRFYVSEGDEAAQNQLLVELDMTEIQSRVKQASLALEKARRDFRRIENLYRDTVVTLEQYENARTALELAESDFKIAEFNRKNSEIRAPSKGKVLKKLKEVNEITGPGIPVIVFASTEADWILKVNLTDTDIVRISIADSAQITFDAYPGRKFSAIVSEVANAANLMAGTYEVELKLMELPEKLVSGLIGQARIYPETRTRLLLPPEALAEATGNQGVVFLFEEGEARRKEIRIGEITDKGIIIISGLKEGDPVITSGSSWLRDGEKVELAQ